VLLGKNQIGVVLHSVPKDGGVFQYSKTVLKAVSALNLNADIYYIYNDSIWHDYLDVKRSHLLKYSKLAPLNILAVLLNRIDRFYAFSKYYKYFRPIYHTLKKLGIELLIYPCPMPWAAEFDIPSIVAVHDIAHRLHSEFPEIADKEMLRKREYLYSNICKKAKTIFVDSECGKIDLLNHYTPKKETIVVLPFVPNEDLMEVQPINVEKNFQLPERYIFYPAQFWRHKNHANLLRAISVLRDTYSVDVPVVFVGCEKNASDDLNKMISDLNLRSMVFTLGYVNDQELVSLYSHAVAMVMPTFLGPTNIPQLEAFMLGCPVVTSRIAGIPEQVGDAALLFDPHDCNEIAEKIFLVWTDKNLRDLLIMKGRQRARVNSHENFSRTFRLALRQALEKLNNEVA